MYTHNTRKPAQSEPRHKKKTSQQETVTTTAPTEKPTSIRAKTLPSSNEDEKEMLPILVSHSTCFQYLIFSKHGVPLLVCVVVLRSFCILMISSSCIVKHVQCILYPFPRVASVFERVYVCVIRLRDSKNDRCLCL